LKKILFLSTIFLTLFGCSNVPNSESSYIIKKGCDYVQDSNSDNAKTNYYRYLEFKSDDIQSEISLMQSSEILFTSDQEESDAPFMNVEFIDKDKKFGIFSINVINSDTIYRATSFDCVKPF
jgi:hypothetical protein